MMSFEDFPRDETFAYTYLCALCYDIMYILTDNIMYKHIALETPAVD